MMASKTNLTGSKCWVSILALASLFWNSVDCFAIADNQGNFTKLSVDCSVLNASCAAPEVELLAEVRHEIVKRGSHPQELPAAEYVVVGAFKSAANAQRFSSGLHNLNYKTHLGYLTATELWYVYILKTGLPNKARSEQQRLSKVFLLRDAWLLTVEP